MVINDSIRERYKVLKTALHNNTFGQPGNQRGEMIGLARLMVDLCERIDLLEQQEAQGVEAAIEEPVIPPVEPAKAVAGFTDEQASEKGWEVVDCQGGFAAKYNGRWFGKDGRPYDDEEHCPPFPDREDALTFVKGMIERAEEETGSSNPDEDDED